MTVSVYPLQSEPSQLVSKHRSGTTMTTRGQAWISELDHKIDEYHSETMAHLDQFQVHLETSFEELRNLILLVRSQNSNVSTHSQPSTIPRPQPETSIPKFESHITNSKPQSPNSISKQLQETTVDLQRSTNSADRTLDVTQMPSDPSIPRVNNTEKSHDADLAYVATSSIHAHVEGNPSVDPVPQVVVEQIVAVPKPIPSLTRSIISIPCFNIVFTVPDTNLEGNDEHVEMISVPSSLPRLYLPPKPPDWVVVSKSSLNPPQFSLDLFEGIRKERRESLRKRLLQHQSCCTEHSPRLLPPPEPPDRITILTPSQVTSSCCTTILSPGIVPYRLLTTTFQVFDQMPKCLVVIWVTLILDYTNSGSDITTFDVFKVKQNGGITLAGYIEMNICLWTLLNYGVHDSSLGNSLVTMSCYYDCAFDDYDGFVEVSNPIITQYSSKLAEIGSYEFMLGFCYSNGIVNISASGLLVKCCVADYTQLDEYEAVAFDLFKSMNMTDVSPGKSTLFSSCVSYTDIALSNVGSGNTYTEFSYQLGVGFANDNTTKIGVYVGKGWPEASASNPLFKMHMKHGCVHDGATCLCSNWWVQGGLLRQAGKDKMDHGFDSWKGFKHIQELEGPSNTENTTELVSFDNGGTNNSDVSYSAEIPSPNSVMPAYGKSGKQWTTYLPKPFHNYVKKLQSSFNFISNR